MRQLSYTEARATFAKVLDTATDDLEEFAAGGFVPGERLDLPDDDDSTGVA
ncbi:hypothetical protein [Nocardia sp. NBC_00416]|uniref:hypothetical protein n=1 Tax=Nocardia sp. NBC_00416 TaxID=2975991 RepID=UPI002E1DDE79